MINIFTTIFTTSNLSLFISIANLIIVFVIIFLERKNPSATLAWIMVLFFVPVVGFVFYMIFSQNFSRIKIDKLTDNEQTLISEALKNQISEVGLDDFQFVNNEAKNWKHMIKLNQVYSGSFLTQNNTIEMLPDGKRMFHKLLRDLREAKYAINVEYYIIKNDMVGQRLIEVLTEKASEGVSVRLLIDSLGSRSLNNRKLKDFRKAGGKVCYFFKPKLKFINMKLNYRNHRKIVVIDGQIGYIGGFNIANEYLGFKKRFGYWRDMHIRLLGGGVQDLNARFIKDWRFSSHEKIELDEAYYTPVTDDGYSAVQIVACGPESPKEEIKRGFMKMITYAEKNVYLQTPYFIPDASILESLKMAAQSGVDVRVMIPCKPDHMFVYWATMSYCGELLRSGARVFVYDNGFLHAKTIVADSQVSSIGSANFDRRSFRLNFEANAFIYDKDIAQNMEELFKEDMLHGHELTLDLYNKRSTWIKFKEAVSRLLSDVL